MTFRRHIILLMMFAAASFAAAQTSVEWRDSLKVINEMIETKPYSSDLHLRKAAINLEMGQWEYAADEYGIVLGVEPDNPAALFYRAYAYTGMRRYDLARKDYEEFLKLVPRNMEAMLGLAHVNTKLKRTTEALDQLNRLVELYPDSAVVYVARAGVEKDMRAYDAALFDWTNAVMRAPDNTDYLLSKADILLLLGRKEEARECLERMVKLGVPRGPLREWFKRCR